MEIIGGGVSSIVAELELINYAIRDNNDYFHYLQGADLPLKTPDEIDRFFSQGGIFLSCGENHSAFANYKVLCKHYLVDNKYYRNNKILKYIDHAIACMQKPFMMLNEQYGKLYSGSALWSIPLDFARFVFSMNSDIRKMYKYSLAADEVFMQTLCKNSQYKEEISKCGNVRYIDWKNGEGNSPKTYTISDFPDLIKAIENDSYMFARKFDENKDLNVALKVRDLVMKEKC